MTAKAKNLKKDFLGLTRLEQLELMQYFLEVFATKPISKEEEKFVLSNKWKKELDLRSEEVKLGKVKLLDNDEVLAQFGL
ncbi:MAG: addiction module protein [Saprospiraceae bacterium]